MLYLMRYSKSVAILGLIFLISLGLYKIYVLKHFPRQGAVHGITAADLPITTEIQSYSVEENGTYTLNYLIVIDNKTSKPIKVKTTQSKFDNSAQPNFNFTVKSIDSPHVDVNNSFNGKTIQSIFPAGTVLAANAKTNVLVSINFPYNYGEIITNYVEIAAEEGGVSSSGGNSGAGSNPTPAPQPPAPAPAPVPAPQPAPAPAPNPNPVPPPNPAPPKPPAPPPAPKPVCTSFTYGPWGECKPNGRQTRSVTSRTPKGCTGGNPVTSQKCTYVAPPPAAPQPAPVPVPQPAPVPAPTPVPTPNPQDGGSVIITDPPVVVLSFFGSNRNLFVINPPAPTPTEPEPTPVATQTGQQSSSGSITPQSVTTVVPQTPPGSVLGSSTGMGKGS